MKLCELPYPVCRSECLLQHCWRYPDEASVKLLNNLIWPHPLGIASKSIIEQTQVYIIVELIQ